MRSAPGLRAATDRVGRPRPAWPVRLVVPLLAALCLGIPLAWTLLSWVPDRREEPLATMPPEIWNWQTVAVPIPGIAFLSDAATYVHAIALTSAAVPQLLAHEELHLLVASYDTAPEMADAALVVEGTGCTYRTAPGARFPNNEHLVLHRGTGCQPLQGTPSGRLDLTVALRNTARLAIWTFRSGAPASSTPIAALIDVPVDAPARAAALGRTVTVFSGSSRRRVDLLAYVWQLTPGSAWIWWVVGLTIAGVSAGTVLLWTAAGVRGRPPAVRALGALCIAAALSLLYAVMTPPFQAADEPNHVASFAVFAERPGLIAEASAWARLAHFERIQFHPAERFRPSDIGRPGVEWNDGTVPEAHLRGSGVQAVWGPAAWIVRDWPVPRVLLALRAFNALLFGIGAGAFVWLAVRLALVPVPSAQWLAWPLFFIPTLPFFAMHVSNHAPLVSAYAAVALGTVLLTTGSRAPAITGLLIGAGWSAAVALSRSALPLGLLIAALLIGRIVLGDRRGRIGTALGFWLGFTAPVVALALSLDASFVSAQATLADTRGLSSMTVWVLAVAHQPWLLLLLALVAAGVEIGLGPVRRAAGERIRKGAGTVVAAGAAGAAVAIVVVMVSSLWVRYPSLARVDPAHPVSAASYVANAFQAAVTSPRLRHHDHLTSVSFWGGFGWIDTIPPEWFISALTGLSGAALALLLLRVARQRDIRAGLWLAFLAAGAAMGLCAYAFSALAFTPADLHGRYLLGLYLVVLTVAWSPLAAQDPHASGWWRRAAAATGVLCIAAIHGYCLHLILTRYF